MIKFLMDHSKELSIAGALSVLTICYFQQKENTKLRAKVKITNVDSLVQVIKTLEKEKDSIYWEAFPKEIELGRYQVAFGIFAERNPKAADQYAEIVSNETE